MRKWTVLVALIVAVALAGCAGGGGGGAGQTAQPGNADNGKTVFEQTQIGDLSGCVTCHSVEAGKTLVGPSLAGIKAKAEEAISSGNYKGSAKTAEEFIRESIVNPDAYVEEGFTSGVMPKGYDKALSAQQLNDLIAYLMSL